jgi:hypothetical protein
MLPCKLAIGNWASVSVPAASTSVLQQCSVALKASPLSLEALSQSASQPASPPWKGTKKMERKKGDTQRAKWL